MQPGGAALVLGIRKMDVGLDLRAAHIVPQEKASRHREPHVADNIGIAEEPRESPPVRNLGLCLSAVKDRLAKRDGKADRRAQDLIVVGVVVDVAAEVVRVKTYLANQALDGTKLEIVSV